MNICMLYYIYVCVCVCVYIYIYMYYMSFAGVIGDAEESKGHIYIYI